jgi:hypothetical protein
MKRHKLLLTACLWIITFNCNAAEEIKLSCIGVVDHFIRFADGSIQQDYENGHAKQVNVMIKKEPVGLKSKETDWVAYFGSWAFYYDRNPLSHNWLTYSDYKNLEFNFLWVDEDSIKGKQTFDYQDSIGIKHHTMISLEINRVTGEFDFYRRVDDISPDKKNSGDFYYQKGTCKKSTHKF